MDDDEGTNPYVLIDGILSLEDNIIDPDMWVK